MEEVRRENVVSQTEEPNTIITNEPVIEKTDSIEQENSINEDEAVTNEEIGVSDDGSNGSESIHEDDEDRGSESDISDENDENLEDEESLTLKREEGDGQESVPTKKVDDDEDKRNPQYIPKRGTFYEHDDRTAVDEEAEEEKEGEEGEKKERIGAGGDAETAVNKKKVWNEKEGSRWTHDKYNDDEQAPKSRNELVSIYGYDIRNEDGPPRARRRRRYGRGPNKYTRNWEDEDAYNKGLGTGTPKVRPPRKSRTRGEEFPPLQDNNTQSHSPDNQNQTTQQTNTPPQRNSRNGQTQNENLFYNSEDREKTWPSVDKKETPKQPKSSPPPVKRETFYQDSNPAPTRVIKPTRPPGPEDLSRGRGITKTRGWRGAGRPNADPRRKPTQETEQEYIVSQNFINKNINSVPSSPAVEEVERGVANMNVRDNANRPHNRAVPNVPPRLQSQSQEGQRQGAPKRYSSLRQRSLPETAVGAQGGPPQQAGPPNNAPAFTPHHGPPPPTIIHYTPHSEYAQQGATTHVVTNNTQPLMQPAYPVPQFAQAPYAGPAFMGPQAPPPGPPPPQIINFAPQPPQGPQVPPPPPAQFPPQVDYASFPHQQFAPVNQTQAADVYHHQTQTQGGITYYSMQSQQVMQMQRIQAQKRPKAAIPIVPPPELKEPRGRGRLQTQNEEPTIVGADTNDYEEREGNYNNEVTVQQ